MTNMPAGTRDEARFGDGSGAARLRSTESRFLRDGEASRRAETTLSRAPSRRYPVRKSRCRLQFGHVRFRTSHASRHALQKTWPQGFVATALTTVLQQMLHWSSDAIEAIARSRRAPKSVGRAGVDVSFDV